ncbi:uncharacterized protein LOC103524791, partial [Diaphorina citri]|uniref:Uncharacterized protein LOC103524791 n=1 Tax=Diaphorina citri TaxID=121845 RepID=A0A1S3DV28_DIACI
FATNVACVYLLSWVILHEQFVGVRIFAVILCDTGIALLAYMDGRCLFLAFPTAVDVVLYGAQFYGMKLAGIILISIGFFLVMFPNNWPDYITRLLRNIVLLTHSTRWSRNRGRHGTAHSQRADIDYRTGYIRSHLRSPSGRVR